MYLVFSDLDGTLLDHDTYDYQPALEGLMILRKYKVPLILVSSKTLPEMKILHEEMNLDAPFIFENGGGIFWPGEKDNLQYLGTDVSELKAKKDLLEAELEDTVRFITDMSPEEIMNRTGLSHDKALLSQRRSTSLPFVVPSGRTMGSEELDGINAGLMAKGLSITKGGRFYHLLSARSDKGSAIKQVIDYYLKDGENAITTIAIGDSENDVAMFRAVDIPVTVRKKDGSIIKTGIEHIRNTSGIGPDGFSEAVKLIILYGVKGLSPLKIPPAGLP